MADGPPADGSPADDRLDRERFYASPDQLDGEELEDDGEYELEPVDPHVLESERQRAKAEVIRAETSLNVDDLYVEAGEGADLDEFLKDFKFRFQVKHMLMGTAALAVFLSAAKLIGSNVAAMLLVILAALIAAHAYLGWRDRKREARLAAKRQWLVEVARRGEQGEEVNQEELDALVAMEDGEFDAEATERPAIRFRFSMKEILITLTVVSVLFGMLSYLNFAAVAAVLGLLAIVGLVAFSMGVVMPPLVMLGWWIVLLLYIVVSIAGMFVGTES
ncbi:MAG: hypothetical protein AAGF31_10345 [Planctomycetota bacterium]